MVAGSGARSGHAAKRGFTLFEIAVSLAIAATAVTSVMLVFPAGMKSQTMARYQIYAAAKALELVDGYTAFHTANPAMDSEAPAPWMVSSTYGNLAPDLEHRLASFRFGLFPLPIDLARRIDSDGDEIQRILDDGAYLYYSQPLATTGFKETAVGAAPPNEAQRLVFAVVGHAQQNALTHFPWKNWPYYVPYPSPPAHGHGANEPGYSKPANRTPVAGMPSAFRARTVFLWEDLGCEDPDMRFVFDAADDTGTAYGYRDHLKTHDRASAERYCRAALWYLARKGFGAELDGITAGLTDWVGAPDQAGRRDQVRAMRFLAHAASCLTAYVPRGELDAGVALAPVAFVGAPATAIAMRNVVITSANIAAYHDTCLDFAMRFASRHPYDWLVPRPLNRQTMMDFPLLQWDLFTAPLSGTIPHTAIRAEQWRPIAADTDTLSRSIGRGFQFMNLDVPSTDPAWPSGAGGAPFWGDPSRFTLAEPFAPSERCRQLVFWAVDWQAWEDFETAPSAPVDAGRYPLSAPFLAATGFASLMERFRFMDWQQFGYRNPEKTLAFTNPSVATAATGSDVAAFIAGNDNVAVHDRGATPVAMSVFSGRWGADRNANKRLDRGPVPRSQRLRASTVGRFNYYDLRVMGEIR
ncbi:MAG TPA: hypothetical protein VEL07_05955 [Planctomycetota bacterium]|nr:hypothetical protein [Planctomycetota bacterium]